MKIKVHKIPEEGFHVEGEDSPSMFDVTDPLFRFEQPVRYKLDLLWVDERKLLVRGRLETITKARCVRTLEWFEIPLVVEDFETLVEEIPGDEVDLTPEIREDILLLLPSNPVSPQAKPLTAAQKKDLEAGSGVWGKLDKLKLK